MHKVNVNDACAFNVCVCGCSECVRLNPQTEADKRMYGGQSECDWMTVYAAMISLIYNGCPNGAPGPSRLQKSPHHYRLTDDRTSRADIILFILDLWYGGVTHSSVSSDDGKAHRWYSWKELRISIYRTKVSGTALPETIHTYSTDTKTGGIKNKQKKKKIIWNIITI